LVVSDDIDDLKAPLEVRLDAPIRLPARFQTRVMIQNEHVARVSIQIGESRDFVVADPLGGISD
jgi:hypothetical protein